MNTMNQVKKSSYSLMSLLGIKSRRKFLKPVINFQNSIEKYKITIAVPENLVDDLKMDVTSSSINFDLMDFHHRIGFPEEADTRGVKAWYEDGVYRVEIPKDPLGPVERLNKLTLNYV